MEFVLLSVRGDPESYEEAMMDNLKRDWLKAMQEKKYNPCMRTWLISWKVYRKIK